MGFWRWITGALTPEQQAVIEKQYKSLDEVYQKKATSIRKRDDSYADKANKKCPNCGGMDNIVDKIAQVVGEGKISGDFTLGFGSVSGGSKIDTSAVNHCTNCGHEWVKDVPKRKYSSDLLSSKLDTLGYIVSDTEWAQRYLDDYLNIFGEYYAETIRYAYKDIYYKCASSTGDNLSLKNLKKHFKSVKDGK